MTVDRPRWGSVHALLLTYQRPVAFERALAQVESADPRPDRLVIVDNAPTTRTREIGEAAVARHPWIEYLPSATNLGAAGGRAVAMRRLLGSADDRDWIVFLDDDDPLPDPSVFRRVQEFAESRRALDPRLGGVAIRGARFDSRRGYPVPVMRAGSPDAICVDYLHGGFFPFYSVSAVRQVGVFDARLFFGWADLEYGLRLGAGSYHLCVSTRLWEEFVPRMGHPEEAFAPSRTLGPADARRYYTMRNRFHILRRYGRSGSALRVFTFAGIAKPVANLVRTPALALAHLRLNLRATLDAARGRYGVGPEPWGSASPSPVEDEASRTVDATLRGRRRVVG